MTGFKTAFGIEKTDWRGISNHLGELTRVALAKQNKTSCDLTNYLREQGNQYILPEYVDDYLSGKASFGCFFKQFRDVLEIKAEDVFKNCTKEEASVHLNSLDKYLLDCSNPDFLITFLTKQPGKELRNFVKDTLNKKREEAINKPYQTMDVGLNAEEETNHYMKDRVELKKFILDFTSDLIKLADGKPLLLLPQHLVENKETSIQAVQAVNAVNALYQGVIQIVEKASKERFDAESKIIPGSRLVIQDAVMRGRKGFTIDFLLPDGDYYDKMISTNQSGFPYFNDQFIGLDAWIEAYTQGTFSSILKSEKRSMQPLSNIGMALGMGVDELTPLRKFEKSEK